MKNRLLVFVARCFLVYQFVKFVKSMTRILNYIAEKKVNGDRPRTTYSRSTRR